MVFVWDEGGENMVLWSGWWLFGVSGKKSCWLRIRQSLEFSLYICRFNTAVLVQGIAFEEAWMINKFSLGDIWLSSAMSAQKEQGQRSRKSNQGELFGVGHHLHKSYSDRRNFWNYIQSYSSPSDLPTQNCFILLQLNAFQSNQTILDTAGQSHFLVYVSVWECINCTRPRRKHVVQCSL